MSTTKQIEYQPTDFNKITVYNEATLFTFNISILTLQKCIRIYIGNSTLLEFSIALLMNLKLFITEIVVHEGVHIMCYTISSKT